MKHSFFNNGSIIKRDGLIFTVCEKGCVLSYAKAFVLFLRMHACMMSTVKGIA